MPGMPEGRLSFINSSWRDANSLSKSTYTLKKVVCSWTPQITLGPPTHLPTAFKLAIYVWTKQPFEQWKVVTEVTFKVHVHTSFKSHSSQECVLFVITPHKQMMCEPVHACVYVWVRCVFTSSISCITCSSSSTTTRVSLLFLKSRRVILGLGRQSVCFR